MTPNNNSRFDGWTDLEKDILIRIFMTFNVVELIRGASVCKSWREAASEPCLWKILDLSKLEAENFRHQQPEQSSQRVMDIVNSAFSLSKGSVSCLILHFHAYITSQHLVCVSERTPNLRRLVLPVRDNDIQANEFKEAAKNWPNLESLTVPRSFPIEIMKAIGRHCKNLSELKIQRRFDMVCAENILAYASGLKVLSLRCNMVHIDAILFLLKEMRQLEVVNISHCLILEHIPNEPVFMSLLFELDEFVLQEAWRLKEFLFCQTGPYCHSCYHQIYFNGIKFWCQSDEGIWMMDESDMIEPTSDVEWHIPVGYRSRIYTVVGVLFQTDKGGFPVLDTDYKAALKQVDFKTEPEEVLREVNSWGKKETKGLIESILPPDSVSTATRLILANALYFKGEWDREFEASDTRVSDFHLLHNAGSVKAHFMTKWSYQFVRAFESFKVLKLLYKQGQDYEREFSLYIFLPNTRNGLPSLIEQFCSNVEFIDSHLPDERVLVRPFLIPKFKISCGFEASKLLETLGFSPGGLTEMVDSPEPLYVSRIIHKAFIEVNEKGTEAAAVTATCVSMCCAREPPRPIDFVADHPFLYLIREEVTKTVMFVGQVLNPIED